MKLDIHELAAGRAAECRPATSALERALDEFDGAVLDDPDGAEQRLWRLHYQRGKPILDGPRQEACTFLTAMYLHTADVRFFNELLWFLNGSEGLRAHGKLAAATFQGRLDRHGCHPFPGAERGEMLAWLDTAVEGVAQRRDRPADRTLRVGLLGSPSFFPAIRRELAAAGHPVECYFIPFHPDRKIRLVLTTRPLFNLLRRFKGVEFPFQTLSVDPRQAGAVLGDASLDIGLHKLGFILDEELFSPFSRGLINDHWGLLPFVRGRSSLEYSLLLGVPIAATTHRVTAVVDGGDLVGVYPYPHLRARCASVRQLRNAIRADLDHRAVDSIGLMARGEAPTLPNDVARGRTFTEMHPALVRFVDQTMDR